MRAPRDRCCCGCSLRYATAACGLLFTILEFYEAVSFFTNADDAEDNPELSAVFGESYRAVHIFGGLSAAVLLGANVFLVAGTLQERASFLLPWLLLYSMLTCFFILSLVLSFDEFEEYSDISETFSLLLPSLASLGIYMFFIIMVFRYYRRLIVVQSPWKV